MGYARDFRFRLANGIFDLNLKITEIRLVFGVSTEKTFGGTSGSSFFAETQRPPMDRSYCILELFPWCEIIEMKTARGRAPHSAAFFKWQAALSFLPISAASLWAIDDLFPASFPFLPPAERPLANGANLTWEIELASGFTHQLRDFSVFECPTNRKRMSKTVQRDRI